MSTTVAPLSDKAREVFKDTYLESAIMYALAMGLDEERLLKTRDGRLFRIWRDLAGSINFSQDAVADSHKHYIPVP